MLNIRLMRNNHVLHSDTLDYFEETMFTLFVSNASTLIIP